MGFLSFLLKKSSSSKRQANTPPKSQSYHTTIPANPPLRGAYPVAGNGTYALDVLSRTYGTWNESQISVAAQSYSDRYSPLFPAHRYFEDAAGRPGTAPNGGFTPHQSHGTNRLRKANPSSHSSNRNSILLDSRQAYFDVRNSYTTERVRADHVQGPSYDLRNSATFARNGLNGFKDILDAQSELKPSDFRTRVHASGARDYGEDVADRNIEENGGRSSVDIHSFYAHSGGLASMPNVRQRYRADSSSNLSLHLNDAGMRTKSLMSQSNYPSPRRPATRDGPVRASVGPDGRLSLEPLPLAARNHGHSQSLDMCPPVLVTANSSLPRSKLGLSQSVMIDSPRLVTQSNSESKDRRSRDLQKDNLLPALSPKIRPNMGRPQSARMSRDFSTSSRTKAELSDADSHRNDNLRTHGRNASFSSAARRGVSVDAVRTLSAKRHSLQHFPISATRPVANIANDSAPLSPARGRPRARSRGELSLHSAVSVSNDPVDSDSDDGGCAPPPSIKRAAMRSVESLDNHSRTRSLTLSLRNLESMGDILDHIPDRDSSLRNGSFTSTTMTMSDSSSNPFHRPQSHHTNNTSVDLSNGFSIKNSSRTSLTSVPGSFATARIPKTPPSGTFNIDDYISSDGEDGIKAAREIRPHGEEELLFRDSGYGIDSAALPGLPDFLSSFGPSSRPRTSNRTRSSSGYHGRRRSRSGASLQGWPRHYVSDPSADQDSSDSASDDDLYDDDKYNRYSTVGGEPLSPPPHMRSSRGKKRLSALGAMYAHGYLAADEVIEEERDPSKIDVATAVRMRKQDKARRRDAALANGGKRRPAHLRASKPGPGRWATGLEADDGVLADMEC